MALGVAFVGGEKDGAVGEMAGASRTAPLISIFHLSWPSE